MGIKGVTTQKQGAYLLKVRPKRLSRKSDMKLADEPEVQFPLATVLRKLAAELTAQGSSKLTYS